MLSIDKKRDERRSEDAMDQMLADEASKTIKVTSLCR